MKYRPFADQIQTLLDKRDWAWVDLAEALGVSKGRVSHIINERHGTVRPETIERIAEVLNVHPWHFDVYVAIKLPQLAVSAPGLITLGRNLLNANDAHQFARLAAKIA